jgi:hypothetical protein
MFSDIKAAAGRVAIVTELVPRAGCRVPGPAPGTRHPHTSAKNPLLFPIEVADTTPAPRATILKGQPAGRFENEFSA